MKPITCREGVRLLLDYEERLIPKAQRERLDEHVAGCSRCRLFVRSYAETPRILREATTSPVPPRVAAALRRSLRVWRR
jgi:predicted anti-sigma-YlaC factor YlaD